jgi:hypothetical protein
VNVYIASVPWSRGASHPDPDPEFTGYSGDSVERIEYRLSVPIGFAFRSVAASGRRRGALTVALVPEITLGSKLLSSPSAEDERQLCLDDCPSPRGVATEVRVEQTWALFVTVRGELDLLPAHDD